MYIKVKVMAGVRKESVVKKGDDEYLVCVREVAERNMANGRVLQIVAGIFSVPKGKVRIISGHKSPSKILSVML